MGNAEYMGIIYNSANKQMKVFKDLISGDEFFSDSYPHVISMNEACYEVTARYVKKGGDQIAIASDDIIEDDNDAPTVIDIVDSFQLNEITFNKKDFGAWAKGYLKTVSAKLVETGKEDRVAGFKTGATELVKFIMSKFDEMQMFCGQKYDMEGAICYAYNKDNEENPTFLFFKDGLKEEKF